MKKTKMALLMAWAGAWAQQADMRTLVDNLMARMTLED